MPHQSDEESSLMRSGYSLDLVPASPSSTSDRGWRFRGKFHESDSLDEGNTTLPSTSMSSSMEALTLNKVTTRDAVPEQPHVAIPEQDVSTPKDKLCIAVQARRESLHLHRVMVPSSNSGELQSPQEWLSGAIQKEGDLIQESQLKIDESFKEIGGALHAVHDGLRTETVGRANAEQCLTGYLAEVRERAESFILKERSRRLSMEAQLTQHWLAKTADVEARIADFDNAVRGGRVQVQAIADEVIRFHADLISVREHRLKRKEELMERVAAKFTEIRLAASAEQRLRQDSASTLLELFGDMGQKLQLEVDAAKRDRQKSTHRIVSLMEGILPRFDQAHGAFRRVDHVQQKLALQKDVKALANALGQEFRQRKGNCTLSTESGKALLIRSGMIDM
eukprot:TRINITY_DN63235_c0_g1_i1.p1 TRINITY_DN63235_c0_g1~~TRINITY_DN63235_c0_g1_i1.p1  ORF type:complete len:394 (+),score=60.11 TRINITY_DN63235_c0_g1_i1:165-1346(+)